MNGWLGRPWRLYGTLALTWFLLHFRLLTGKRVLPWDASDEFYPMVFFNAQSLRHGLAPWWNPYIYGGYPQIADPQGMLFSPWLTGWMMIPNTPGQTWFAWGVLLHLLMGGCAMLALLRRMRCTDMGALMGAVVYLAGGVAASRLEHVSIAIAYAWAPVVWLTLHRFLSTPTWARAALFGIAAGLMLTSLVQFSYLMTFALIAYGIVGSITSWSRYDAGARLRWAGGMLLAGVLALAIGLPQVVLSAAFASLSNRAELPLDAAAPGSLNASTFLTLFSPNALHALRGQYTGSASIVEAYLYIGVLPLLLLGAGLASAWRDAGHRRQLMFLGAMGVAATLYAMGTQTPFYGWLYEYLPGMKLFRRPSDGAYLVNLALAMVAGIGASKVRLDEPRQRIWLLAIATVWLTLASLAMRGEGVRWQAPTLAAAVICAVALWRLRRPQVKPALVAAWLLAVIVVDYRCFNLNGTFNEGRDPTRAFLQDDAVTFLQARVAATPSQLPPRVEPVRGVSAWDNLVIRAGLPSTQGYNPMRYALYDQWYGARGSMNDAWPDRPYNRMPGDTMSALLGAEYIVRAAVSPDDTLPPLASDLELIHDGHTQIWRNPRAYARILTPVHMRADVAPPTPAQMQATDFRDEFWLSARNEADRAAALATAAQCTSRVTIAAARQTPTSLALTTRSPDGAGWVVVSELDFPGWEARIDGTPVSIHPANGMFRAVCVPAGEHTLSFRFSPWEMVVVAYQRHRAKAL